MTVWTLRHPPVDRQGRCIGQTVIKTTIPDGEAVQRAIETAPFRPNRIFTSDLPRCATLAHGLAKAWVIPVHAVPQLREMNFGEWEGRNYDSIEAEDGQRWHHWCENWQTAAPPGGESLDAFVHRIHEWLKNNPPIPTDAIVTHAGVIRTFRVFSGSTWDEAMQSNNPFLGWTEHSLSVLGAFPSSVPIRQP